MATRRRKAYFKACMKCKMLVPPNVEICPNCGSRDFSEEWEGMIIVFDVENSMVAKRLNITRPGRYAIKLRA
ncbi:MAG: transcription elongation factor subunit Spt4 [Thermofilaceae archaeon]